MMWFQNRIQNEREGNTRSGSSNSDGRASSFSCSSRTSNAAQVRDPRIYPTPLLTLTLTIHASSSLPYITRKTSDTRSDGAVVQGTYHPATHALQAVRITPRFRARQLTCSVRSSFYSPGFSKLIRVDYNNWIARDTTLPLSEIRLLSLYSDGAPSMRFRLSALVQSCWNGFAVMDCTSFC